MKRIALVVLVILMFGNTVLCQVFAKQQEEENKTERGFNIQAGDVIIAKGHLRVGFIWHSGIAVSEKNILHINSLTEGPKLTSWKKWQSAYLKRKGQWIKVYRHFDENVAKAAAKWAKDTYYKNKNVVFGFEGDLMSTGIIYCSKIVWQAYYFGPEKPSISGDTEGLKLTHNLHRDIAGISLKYIKILKKRNRIKEVYM